MDNTQLTEENESTTEIDSIIFPLDLMADETRTREFGQGFYNSLFALDIRSVTYEKNETICSIHLTEMTKQNVRIGYGLFGPDWWSYSRDIRELFFPNCDDFIQGGCVIGYERHMNIYVCEDCNIDRNKWMEDNWDFWKEKYSWVGTGFL